MEEIRFSSSSRKETRGGNWHLLSAVSHALCGAQNDLALRWVTEGDMKEGTFQVSPGE